MCPLCDALGKSDNQNDLYWNLDTPAYEFDLAEFIRKRIPSRGICALIGCLSNNVEGFDQGVQQQLAAFTNSEKQCASQAKVLWGYDSRPVSRS